MCRFVGPLESRLTAIAENTNHLGTAAAFAMSFGGNLESFFRATFRGAENAGFTTHMEPLAQKNVGATASLKLGKGNLSFGALLDGEVFSNTGSESFWLLDWTF